MPATVSLRYPLVLLAAAGFVSSMSLRLAEPLLPGVAREFAVSVVEAAVVITAFALAYGLFQLLHGPLGDRFGKLRVVCGALFLAALTSAACATADSIHGLAAWRFATGMTAGAVIPLSFAFVGDNVPLAQRQQVMGRFISGTLLGAALGPLIGGACSQFLGWRASFVVPALAFAATGALLLPLARKEPRPARSALGPLASFRLLAQSRSARIICGVVALEGWLFYGAFGFLGAFLHREFELDYLVVGLVLAGFGLGGLLYSASVGVLVERLGMGRMVTLGGCMLLAGFCGVAIVKLWVVSVALVLVLGFGFYLMHNSLQTLATEMAPAARGAAIAVFAFALFSGQAVGVVINGQLVTLFGYRPMMGVSGVGLALLAAYLARRIAAGQTH